eukprot:scaffold20418_cov112-Isochrysis_galbana.AAC.8
MATYLHMHCLVALRLPSASPHPPPNAGRLLVHARTPGTTNCSLNSSRPMTWSSPGTTNPQKTCMCVSTSCKPSDSACPSMPSLSACPPAPVSRAWPLCLFPALLLPPELFPPPHALPPFGPPSTVQLSHSRARFRLISIVSPLPHPGTHTPNAVAPTPPICAFAPPSPYVHRLESVHRPRIGPGARPQTRRPHCPAPRRHRAPNTTGAHRAFTVSIHRVAGGGSERGSRGCTCKTGGTAGRAVDRLPVAGLPLKGGGVKRRRERGGAASGFPVERGRPSRSSPVAPSYLLPGALAGGCAQMPADAGGLRTEVPSYNTMRKGKK